MLTRVWESGGRGEGADVVHRRSGVLPRAPSPLPICSSTPSSPLTSGYFDTALHAGSLFHFGCKLSQTHMPCPRNSLLSPFFVGSHDVQSCFTFVPPPRPLEGVGIGARIYDWDKTSCDSFSCFGFASFFLLLSSLFLHKKLWLCIYYYYFCDYYFYTFIQFESDFWRTRKFPPTPTHPHCLPQFLSNPASKQVFFSPLIDGASTR